MRRITRESCRAANACWSDERLASVIPPEGLTPAEVAALGGIKPRDRVWALIYASGLHVCEAGLFVRHCVLRLPGVYSFDGAGFDLDTAYSVSSMASMKVNDYRVASTDTAFALYCEERRAQLADLVALLSKEC